MKNQSLKTEAFSVTCLLGLSILLQPAWCQAEGPTAAAADEAKETVSPEIGITEVKLRVPSWLEEGTETRLNQVHAIDKINQIKLWAQDSKNTLKDYLDSVEGLNPRLKKQKLMEGIAKVVQQSSNLGTETFMRNTLRRGYKVVLVLEKYTREDSPGALDQQLRVLNRSLQMAFKYYEKDIGYLNGVIADKKNDVMNLPYASYGIDYAHFLMALNESILNAAAQYEIGVMTLGLLHVDLSRDEKWAGYAPIINTISNHLELLPESAGGRTDGQLVEQMRQVRKAYQIAMQRLGDLDRAVAERIKVAQMKEEDRIRYERASQEQKESLERLQKCRVGRAAAKTDGSNWGNVDRIYANGTLMISWKRPYATETSIHPIAKITCEIDLPANGYRAGKWVAKKNLANWGYLLNAFDNGLLLVDWQKQYAAELGMVFMKDAEPEVDEENGVRPNGRIVYNNGKNHGVALAVFPNIVLGSWQKQYAEGISTVKMDQVAPELFGPADN